MKESPYRGRKWLIQNMSLRMQSFRKEYKKQNRHYLGKANSHQKQYNYMYCLRSLTKEDLEIPFYGKVILKEGWAFIGVHRVNHRYLTKTK